MPEFEEFEGREIDEWGYTRAEHERFRELLQGLEDAEILSVEIVGTAGPRVVYAETVVQTPDGRKHTSLTILRHTSSGRWVLAIRTPLSKLRDLTDAANEIRRRNARRREAAEAAE